MRAGDDERQFNYAEALQKTLYFSESQQSGRLSPNNRVAWRGPACLEDDRDIGRDLSGGWFKNAGDHWTTNLTMAFAAMTLAWSAVEQPSGWQDAGQIADGTAGLLGFGRERFFGPAAGPCREVDAVRPAQHGTGADGQDFIPGKADDRTACRHVLYGALVAGPDHNDVFLCGKDRRPWLPLPAGQGHNLYY